MLPSAPSLSVSTLDSTGNDASLRWLADFFSAKTVSWSKELALATPQRGRGEMKLSVISSRKEMLVEWSPEKGPSSQSADISFLGLFLNRQFRQNSFCPDFNV